MCHSGGLKKYGIAYKSENIISSLAYLKYLILAKENVVYEETKKKN
jgi:hypothetical protein